MGAPSDRDRTAIWRDLVMATHLLDTALERQSQRDGQISHGHFKILVLLAEAPGRAVSLKSIADTLRFSISRISHAVSVLEREGLVERRAVQGGRRAFEALLTADGRDKVRDVIGPQRREIRDPLLGALDDDDLRDFGRIAARLVAQLEEQPGAGTP
jgi:DNA-binding MarR family transcriptional regulator